MEQNELQATGEDRRRSAGRDLSQNPGRRSDGPRAAQENFSRSGNLPRREPSAPAVATPKREIVIPARIEVTSAAATSSRARTGSRGS